MNDRSIDRSKLQFQHAPIRTQQEQTERDIFVAQRINEAIARAKLAKKETP
jgi:hypothetical protein